MIDVLHQHWFPTLAEPLVLAVVVPKDCCSRTRQTATAKRSTDGAADLTIDFGLIFSMLPGFYSSEEDDEEEKEEDSNHEGDSKSRGDDTGGVLGKTPFLTRRR